MARESAITSAAAPWFALNVEIGIGMQGDFVAVVGKDGIVAHRLHAGCRSLFGPPSQGFLGVACPDFHKMAVRAVVALPVDEGDACLKRRFVVRVDVEIGAHVAGGLGGVDILDACDSRTVFESGMNGGQARFARAYNDDVVLFRFGEVYDRLGCLQESGAGRCGGFGLFRGCVGLAASGEASGGKCAHSGNSGCLKEVAARYAKLCSFVIIPS